MIARATKGLSAPDGEVEPAGPLSRRTIMFEVVVVLSIFPLGYVTSAIANATLQLVSGPPPGALRAD
ncbi:MAG TPA: hypothetical protein VNV65_11710 [Candidatus Solibacter sp.]|nr:hypothetical protein [Candidatus Solibacter sp.]